MCRNLHRTRFCDGLREVANQQFLEDGLLGKGACQNRLFQGDFAVGKKNGDLRRCQAASHLRAFSELFFIRQEFDSAIKTSVRLQEADELPVCVEKLATVANLQRHRLRLLIVVHQHPACDVVSHRSQQSIALLDGHVAALQQGVRNANDAISLIQTADGALSVIDEKLIRMKELAEQAATGTYDSTQRLMIDSEYQAMASEITRIANATDFNGLKLLDGSLSGDTHSGSAMESTGKMKIHFGTMNDSAEDYYYIQIGTSTASALGVGNQATAHTSKADARTVSTQEAAQKALVGLNAAVVSKDKIRAHLGALQNRLENTISNLTTQSQNLQAAESRISDVDVATEMTSFVRNQILTQSAVAMLSQANSMPQMAMKLIG